MVSLWHKRAIRKIYKKCRFATFTHCLRIASVLAHARNPPFYYLSTLGLAHVILDPRPCVSFRVTANGAGLGSRLCMWYKYCTASWLRSRFFQKSKIVQSFMACVAKVEEHSAVCC